MSAGTVKVETTFTAKELGALWKLTPREVRKLFRPGKIWPVIRLNAIVIRVPESSVLAYLESRTWNPEV